MQPEADKTAKLQTRDLMDLLIRTGLVVLFAVICLWIFSPFAGVVAWALVLAVALYPLHGMLSRKIGGGPGRASTVMVLAGLLLIGVPTVMLGASFATHIHDLIQSAQAGTLHVPEPSPSVAGWPLVGQQLHAAWSEAATNLPQFIADNKAQLAGLTKKALGAAAGTAGGVFLFLGALIIAGIMMAYGESGGRSIERIISRVVGPEKGPGVHKLSIATIRSVAMGVIGVAVIQALLLGVGFIIAGVPAAGLLALVVLFVGILQLPALIVSLPVIGYIWWAGDGSTAAQVFYTVYLLVAGAVDNVLKPLLLGRGVDAPMPVILLGALGGMVVGGFIGLFLGAVVLAIGYQLFMGWVAEGTHESPAEAAEAEASPASD